MPIKVTIDDLLSWGANIKCRDMQIFQKEWPDGAELTAKNIRRAIELGLDVNFVASRVLPLSVWKVYDEAVAPAAEACTEAVARAWKAYEEAIVREFIKQLGLLE